MATEVHLKSKTKLGMNEDNLSSSDSSTQRRGVTVDQCQRMIHKSLLCIYSFFILHSSLFFIIIPNSNYTITSHYPLFLNSNFFILFLKNYFLLHFDYDIDTVWFEFDVLCWITGKAGVNFYTQIKTITQQWKDSTGGSKINLAMPTSQK